MAAFGVALTLGFVSGCQESPFRSDLPRTPYERYQVLRGDYRPVSTEDEFGVDQKALRQRLAPLRAR